MSPSRQNLPDKIALQQQLAVIDRQFRKLLALLRGNITQRYVYTRTRKPEPLWRLETELVLLKYSINDATQTSTSLKRGEIKKKAKNITQLCEGLQQDFMPKLSLIDYSWYGLLYILCTTVYNLFARLCGATLWPHPVAARIQALTTQLAPLTDLDNATVTQPSTMTAETKIAPNILAAADLHTHLQAKPPKLFLDSNCYAALVDPDTRSTIPKTSEYFLKQYATHPIYQKILQLINHKPKLRDSYLQKFEDALLAQFRADTGKCGRPDRRPALVTLADIDLAYQSCQASNTIGTKSKPTFTIAKRLDAGIAGGFAAFDNALHIGAAQGNGLEAPTCQRVAPVFEWPADKTQGPAQQLTAPDAALARMAFRNTSDMVISWLNKYDSARKIFFYKNGYLTPNRDQLAQALTLLQNHGQALLTNLQRVYVKANCKENKFITTTHMPCFAMNIGQTWDMPAAYQTKSLTPAESAQLDQACGRLLQLQYTAAAQAAVIQAHASGKRTTLVLTPLGGGVFGNGNETIAKAMSGVADIVANQPVDVILSVWQPEQVPFWKAQVAGFKNAVVIGTEHLWESTSLKEARHKQQTQTLAAPLTPQWSQNQPQAVHTRQGLRSWYQTAAPSVTPLTQASLRSMV